ncbi:uncharacterized protein LOC133530457 [Cydia pomonella]|uniref:uncharacterized protein LOC133530457 n=1 Tax=Cydia pomonella TaxID=82600 RepID=UPI002ADD3E20|nr:uncharacterized protein LOC133530457 [Cydia pomonella]
MCKYPALECQPIEDGNEVDNEAEENNAMSEDEDDSDVSDSDSYYSDSSVNIRTESESDGESASAHRVTPDMVLLLMLKENGAITEEKYAEKAEVCEKNFRFLIPNIPRSRTSSYNYTRDLSEAKESDDDDENNDSNAGVTDKVLEVNDVNKGTVETSSINEIECDKDITKDRKYNESVEKVDNVKCACNMLENNINVSLDGTSKNQCSVENILSEEQQGNQMECEEVEEHMQDYQENQKERYQEQQKPIRDNLSPENNLDRAIQGTNRDCNKYVLSESSSTESMKNDESQKEIENTNVVVKNNFLENHSISVEDKGIETINNATKDPDNQVALTKPREEAKEDQNLKKHKGEMHKNILQGINLAQVEDNSIETNNNSINDENQKKKVVDQNSKNQNEEPNNLLRENNLESVEDKSKETSNNVSQNTTNPAEDSKIETKNSQTESNLPTGKITKSFKYILKKLIREKRIPKEDEEDRISDEFGEDYAEHLLSFADGLDRDYQNNTAIELSDDEDEDNNLREFAFFLNFYSPSSYKYILETYNTPLPELKVLYSWYLKDDHYPGMSEKAFKILKEKSLAKRHTCTLMFIDIFLNNEGRYCDQVDYGHGEYFKFIDKAVLAYVFVLVSLDEDWKMPIGYIFARNIPAETQAEYIRICLTHCHEAGADVVAVTLDTPTAAEFLGCSFDNIRNLKTTFKHPACDRDVAIWIDPCLALKSARQTLKVKGVLKDDEGKKIRWNLIRQLKILPTDYLIDLEQLEFFELKNHIAKIDLTSETFSKSLIPALDLAEKLLPDTFTDIEPTKRYIAFINMLYNILNSRITTGIRNIALQLRAAKKYLIRLFSNEENKLSPLDRENLAWKRLQGYRYFLKGEPVCGFIGFLICIESFKRLYLTLITQEKRINYLNPQRLCKVHAEDFVTNLRAYDYLDADSLSGERFQDFYKDLFKHLEGNPQFSDNNVPLEHWPLRNKFSPMVNIKLTSGKRSYDDVYSGQYRLKKMKKTSEEERATELVRDYSKAMDTEIDLSIRKNMVGFLAGWIAAKFAKCLKCEECIDLLCADKKLSFHTFITLRWIYALCLPSEEMFRICWECERALRLKGSPMRLKAWVLRRLAPKFPWSKSPKRSKHRPLHHIHLARAVIAKYFALRVPTPFGTKDRKKIVEMYQLFTTRDPDESMDKYRVEELEDWLNRSKEESDY